MSGFEEEDLEERLRSLEARRQMLWWWSVPDKIGKIIAISKAIEEIKEKIVRRGINWKKEGF